MAEAYSQGTDGRIKAATDPAATVTIGYLEEWKITKSLQAYGADGFENAANAGGIVFKRKDLVSMAEAVVTMTGWFDTGNNSEVTLFIGQKVKLDLLLNKTTPFGLTGLLGRVTKIEYGTKATATQPATFACEVALTGVIAPAA